MQLAITAENHTELAYNEVEGQAQGFNHLQYVVKLSRGFGSPTGAPPPLAATVANTKNGRREFKTCLRVDMARHGSDPALKLVLCLKTEADRSLWRQAFLWADNRWNICRRHEKHVAEDQHAQSMSIDALCAATRGAIVLGNHIYPNTKHLPASRIGYLLFMAEGLMSALYLRATDGPERVAGIQSHALLQIRASLAIAIGFGVIFKNKVSLVGAPLRCDAPV